MSKYPSLPYTKAEASDLSDAWYALMRAVESSSLQEGRVSRTLKGLKKHFHEATAKARIIENVRHGLGMPGPETLCNLAHRDDDDILCYMVGVYLRGHDGSGVLRDALDAGRASWGAALSRYLETL